MAGSAAMMECVAGRRVQTGSFIGRCIRLSLFFPQWIFRIRPSCLLGILSHMQHAPAVPSDRVGVLGRSRMRPARTHCIITHELAG